jgi:heterodisulfide reductase subunit A
MSPYGLFICHCGRNIADTVDVRELVERFKEEPDLEVVTDYTYLCSDPGQNLIREAIEEHRLDGIVVASCSPTLHEPTFRHVAETAGLNRYCVEMANIREQCSWVHDRAPETTDKAEAIIRGALAKVMASVPLEEIAAPVVRRAMVIGGGVAGIQAALDIANSGIEVLLVERSPSIGGHMSQLSETFPTFDCSQCILTPKMVEVNRHHNIRLYAYSEVESVSGSVGDFVVRVKEKPRYVNPDLCTSCGDCTSVCPVVVPNEFDLGLRSRKAIYLPFPQAVPSVYTLDTDNCLGLFTLACAKCRDACEAGAIQYDMKVKYVDEHVGAIVVATGFDLYDMSNLSEYGYDKINDVIDGLYFERLLSASGPTGGIVRRPSDGRIPEEVVFIQCAGSREPERHKGYCSKICCMYTAKQAMLFQHRIHGGQSYVFYMDVRTGGRDYEEFYRRALDEGVVYIRGKVSKVFQDGDKIVVRGSDTIAGEPVEIRADMVVLATAMEPSHGVQELVSKLKLGCTGDGWVREVHPKLRPVESVTPGFFLAGCAQGPKDIPETVAQASAAASKVMALLSHDELVHEPIVAQVDEDLCSGCRLCIAQCPYNARIWNETRRVATVNALMCEGCGTCAAGCPSGATRQDGFTDEQIIGAVKAMLSVQRRVVGVPISAEATEKETRQADKEEEAVRSGR